MQNKQLLTLDIETSGLIIYNHGIISLSYIIDDIDGKELTRGTLEMNPLTYSKKVSEKALEINGYTLEQIKTLPDAKEQCLAFIKVLNEFSNGEKYKLVAYNGDFDTSFIKYWMDKLVPSTYWKTIDYKHLDPFAIVKYLVWFSEIKTVDGKESLESIAKHFKIPHNPHDSMSDAEVARTLHYKLSTRIL